MVPWHADEGGLARRQNYRACSGNGYVWNFKRDSFCVQCGSCLGVLPALWREPKGAWAESSTQSEM
eukprot:5072739-Pyramimonas_sp.AAC.1